MTSVRDLCNATMLIRNEWESQGTGVLVGREVQEGKSKIFLVTNKHVLGKTSSLRIDAREINISFNAENPGGQLVGQSLKMALRALDNTCLWREHPERDVDILAVDVTLLTMLPWLRAGCLHYSLLADKAILSRFGIGIGTDILTIGYPSGMTQGTNNFPLVRQGVISTRIGEPFEDEIMENGIKRRRKVRGFVFDGGAIPGSSGSAVVFRPSLIIGNGIQFPPPPPFLLGIVSETFYAPVSEYQRGFAGLGLAFDAETIKETIEQFFPAPDDIASASGQPSKAQ